MKHKWVVENEDAKKALHDLYFETGSLPTQQPKAKAKETEKPAPQVSLPPALASLAREKDVTVETKAAPAPEKPSWLKLAIFVAVAVGLAFMAYQAWPALDANTPQASPKHSRSPFIKSSLQKLQGTNMAKISTSDIPASGALAIEPSLVVVQARPGQSTTQSVTIENKTPITLTFAVDAADLAGQGDKPVFVAAGDSPDSVAASAVISKRFVQVEPMQAETVQVTLTFPSQISSSGVLIRLRSTDNLPLGGTGTMSASFGTVIAFARGNDPAQDSTLPTALQRSNSHWVLSQWATGSSPAQASNAGQVTESGSNSRKGTNLAAVRQ